MLHQDSHAVLNEELQREKDELKNELEMAEKRLMCLTSVHEQCHDTKHALENEIMQLTGRLEKATLESNTTDSMQIVNKQTLQVTPVDTPVNDLMQIVDEQTLKVTPVDTPVNDLMQIVDGVSISSIQ
jgi:predicted nuclease with TOPRIM domain